MSSVPSSSYSSKAYQKTSHAALYSKYRPAYPEALVKLILDYLNKNGGSQDLVVDVGCGSGQFTFQLQEHFKQCVGIDISSAQIKEAQEKASAKENMKFLVGDAYTLPVETGTVDLVTAATSWHWFPEKNKFFTECKRVLKANGCVAVFSYTIRCPTSYVSVNKLIDGFIKNTLKSYVCEGVEQHVWSEYKGVALPFRNVERHNLVMTSRPTVADFIGLVSSLASYQKYSEVHPGNSALEVLQANIMTELMGTGSTCSPHEVQLNLEFPLFILLGKND